MNKEQKEITCLGCDSEFKVVYALESVDGKPQFCPFCGDDTSMEEEQEMTLDEYDDDPIL